MRRASRGRFAVPSSDADVAGADRMSAADERFGGADALFKFGSLALALAL